MTTLEENPKPHGSHEMGADGAPCAVCWIWADGEEIAEDCPGSPDEDTRRESQMGWAEYRRAN